MAEAGLRTYGGAGDEQPGRPLQERLQGHADALVRGERSPLCVTILRAAAADVDAGGLVADLFAGLELPPGSVPALRLLAALHHLVLAGRAPELARFYPSAGGDRSPAEVWPAAHRALDDHAGWVHKRLRLGVQTNEPGRAAVLFGALLWLTERTPLPVRLLEIGASAGLNLQVDRFGYRVGQTQLGDPNSPIQFVDPWRPPPALDLARCAHGLRIAAREGCDQAPLDPRSPEERITALSYIWPDEPERLARTRAALLMAVDDPPKVEAAPAQEWLPRALARRAKGELTVVWQSVVWQYLEPEARSRIELAIQEPGTGGPVTWLRMEPGEERLVGMRLTAVEAADGREQLLAYCDDHGPPIAWEA